MLVYAKLNKVNKQKSESRYYQTSRCYEPNTCMHEMPSMLVIISYYNFMVVQVMH